MSVPTETQQAPQRFGRFRPGNCRRQRCPQAVRSRSCRGATAASIKAISSLRE
jgi:hypothetical protein